MMALAFGTICAVGFLHAQDRRMAGYRWPGSLRASPPPSCPARAARCLPCPSSCCCWRRSCGGARGARSWRFAEFLAVFATVLLAGNVGRMTTRITTGYSNLSQLIAGGKIADHSVGDRTRLLLLSYRLFLERARARRRREGVERRRLPNSSPRRIRTTAWRSPTIRPTTNMQTTWPKAASSASCSASSSCSCRSICS